MLKVMELSSLSFEMGNGIRLGYNCCHTEDASELSKQIFSSGGD